jgi:hypothetical protein
MVQSDHQEMDNGFTALLKHIKWKCLYTNEKLTWIVGRNILHENFKCLTP